MSEESRETSFLELKKQRISLLTRVLTRLERDVAAVEKSKKPVPRLLCENLRIINNELRVEQRPDREKVTGDELKTEVDSARKQAKQAKQHRRIAYKLGDYAAKKA